VEPGRRDLGAGGAVLPAGDLEEARRAVDVEVRRRVSRDPPPAGTDAVVAPIGMFFTRPGQEAAATMEASLVYWHEASRDDFDVIFPGWRWRRNESEWEPEFKPRFFELFTHQVSQRCNYTYSGETDLLLLEFEFRPSRRRGDFVFDEAIAFDLGKLARSAGWESLDRLMQQLIDRARQLRGPDKVAWDMSQGIAYDWARRGLWATLKEGLLSRVIGQSGAAHLDFMHAVRPLQSR
jgi:hypothetical protein